MQAAHHQFDQLSRAANEDKSRKAHPAVGKEGEVPLSIRLWRRCRWQFTSTCRSCRNARMCSSAFACSLQLCNVGKGALVALSTGLLAA